ncbi:MAG: glucose-1-phosphate adenylyltransferase family protein [bacterium]
MKKTLAVVLAGGEGKRLLTLTQRRAKPVVLFGGKYRIIDFVLSNILNSDIHDMGILCQYEPDSLLKHLGFAWRMDRDFCRVDLLFPHKAEDRYLSPADAVLKRLDYILDKNPSHVLIVPGDYVSIIDYRRIIEFHDEKNADMTIAGTMVPEKMTHRFGMMDVGGDGRLSHYVEKPIDPVETRFASMGIYLFNIDVLVRRISEEAKLVSPISFTYGLIPRMLEKDDAVYAYRFDGYWRDVGTIDAYFEANLELIKIMPELNLYDVRNPVRSRTRFEPPAKICEHGSVKNSIISQGCLVDGHVERSIVFPHVRIDKGAEVYDSLIMPNNYIGENTVIRRSILDTVSRTTHIGTEPNIGSGSRIGGEGAGVPNGDHPSLLRSGVTLIGMEAEVPAGTFVGRNCIIYPDVRASDFNGRTAVHDGEVVKPLEPLL